MEKICFCYKYFENGTEKLCTFEATFSHVMCSKILQAWEKHTNKEVYENEEQIRIVGSIIMFVQNHGYINSRYNIDIEKIY